MAAVLVVKKFAIWIMTSTYSGCSCDTLLHTKEFVKITRLYGPECAMQLAIQPSKQVSIQTAASK